ncbi:hypothetical protein [Pelagibacterium limicola]|uniref:hypothetical protein n=1 Tax=Pelagibacterium limicola TaxID=2791022 RepID=UPI0018AFBD74|nr:hypothetical protein [Pelagibacterium limicola]
MSNRVIDSLAGFFGDIGRARAASALYNDLAGLSDQALEARGLSRADLPRYAFDKAFTRR